MSQLATAIGFEADVHALSPDQLRQHQQVVAEHYGLEVYFCDPLNGGGRGPMLALIPPGLFEMGSEAAEFGHGREEEPCHVERLSQAFALGRYTVTAAEFALFQRESGFRFRTDLITSSGQYPVINLRRQQAEDYLLWLSDKSGFRYRLPSEMEWEYACRAGSQTPFSFGARVSCKEVHFNPAFPYEEQQQKRKWFLPRCMPSTSPEPVGSKPANTWGLHDMHGNVWEFTSSPWQPDYRTQRDSARVRRIVVRGGSYFDSATLARSASRRPRVWDELDVNLGFRVLRELD